MATLKESASQTAGPYVHIGCLPQSAGLAPKRMGAQLGSSMITAEWQQASISLDILIFDGASDPVKDAMIEIWQAGPEGEFANTKGFSNWGRKSADPDSGLTRFNTLKPGVVKAVVNESGTQPQQSPHILVWIVARGINMGLTTRIYFPDEDNAKDPTLALAAERSGSLIAEKTAQGYRHSIHLQGPNETVFFDV